MGRSDEAFASLVADPAFLAEVRRCLGADAPALYAYLGALRMKGWMAEVAGAWDGAPADELKDLLAAWSSRYLRGWQPGRPYGYGPLSVGVRTGAGVTTVAAAVRSGGKDAPLGGILRIRTLPPLPALQVERDADDQTDEVTAELQIPLLNQEKSKTRKEEALCECLFLGYDVAYTDGRLHRGVVQRVMVAVGQ